MCQNYRGWFHKIQEGLVYSIICDNGCNRSSSDSSSSSSSDSSASKKKKKSTKKTKKTKETKGAKAKAAQEKADKRELEVFAKAAAKEQAKKDKERAKAIALASSMIVKIKKALRPLIETVSNPKIIHVPRITLEPLQLVIENWESRISKLEKVERGDAEWETGLSSFNAREGKEAAQPVMAILGCMAKYK